MRNGIVAFVTGLLFAIGLGISGMTQPEKVIGFLDIFGNWDPSLIFVMLGGIAFHFITYRWIRSRNLPIWSSVWHVPIKKELTPSLIIGAIIFGMGWGLGGYCPGPAMTSLASFNSRPVTFVISMFVGMYIFRFIDKKIKFRK